MKLPKSNCFYDVCVSSLSLCLCVLSSSRCEEGGRHVVVHSLGRWMEEEGVQDVFFVDSAAAESLPIIN